MAAKATVCVRPSENRVTAHLKPLGREAIKKVMAKEQSVASRRIADNSLPDALITGVCRCCQKMKATASVIRIPSNFSRHHKNTCFISLTLHVQLQYLKYIVHIIV